MKWTNQDPRVTAARWISVSVVFANGERELRFMLVKGKTIDVYELQTHEFDGETTLRVHEFSEVEEMILADHPWPVSWFWTNHEDPYWERFLKQSKVSEL